MQNKLFFFSLVLLAVLVFAGVGCQPQESANENNQPETSSLEREEAPSAQDSATEEEGTDEQPSEDDLIIESETMLESDVEVETNEEVEAEEQTQVREFTMMARQWEFEPSTIRVNEGDTVRLSVTSEDVEHGLALPAFGVSESLQPGQTVTVEFTADKAGTYTFFCSVFCGSGHSDMRGTLIVE